MSNRHALLRWIGHQGWIKFGIRNRLLRLIIKPDEIKPYDFEIDFFGLKYRGNLDNYIDWNVYFFGAYEKQALMLLRDLIRKNKGEGVFLDIGANIGVFSLFMSRHAAVVHSFEPYAYVRSSLERNIVLNSIDNITVHPIALGKTNEELQYYAPTGFNRGTGSFVDSHETLNNKAFKKMYVKEADSYLADYGIGSIDLIKMDVEGFEINILAGLKKTLATFRPVIFMEYSESTRNIIGSESDFMSLLPENYCIKKFNFNNYKYWFTEFDFNVPGGDILITPVQA